MNALLANHFRLVHFLHSVHFLIFFQFDTPDLSESSFAYHVLAIKVLSINLPLFKDQPFRCFFFGVEFRKINFKTVFDILG